MIESFLVTIGVKQGCLLSPLLFLLAIDWCRRTTGIQWTLTLHLEDLDFACDICNLSHRLQNSQHLGKTPKRTGLCIDALKTKAMRINANQNNKFNNTKVEDVKEFTYQRSIISTTGGTEEDIKTRKRKAQQTFLPC
jgi:hypothetical protein